MASKIPGYIPACPRAACPSWGQLAALTNCDCTELPNQLHITTPCSGPRPLLPGAINRAEWVKYLGLFFNLDRVASEYFDSVEAQFEEMAEAVAAAAANASEAAPLVAWVSHYVYLTTESYQVSFAQYKADYTVGAGRPQATCFSLTSL